MSFIKAFLLAILATLFITYALGMSFIQLLDINVYMEDQLIEPLKAISISALVVVLLVVAAVAIVLSVFGTLVFAGLIVAGSIGMVMVGVFWPIFLAAFIIWLVCRDKKQPRYG